jgi:hypothetical protein
VKLVGRLQQACARQTIDHEQYARRPGQYATSLEWASAVEKRKSDRRSGKHVDVLISDAIHNAESECAWVIDRSMGGLALTVEQPRDVGDILTVRPAEASEHIPWVQVEVRYCERLCTGWRLGCKFIRSPPYSVLMLYG